MPSKIIMIAHLIERLLNPEVKRQAKIGDIKFAVMQEYITIDEAIELTLEFIDREEQ